MKNKILLLAILTLNTSFLQAQDSFWNFISENEIQIQNERRIIPEKYKTLKVDFINLKKKLNQAPIENFTKTGLEISLPMPDGKMQRFVIRESSIMESELQEKFPEIKTFVVFGLDDKTASGRLDYTLFGFHAMIRTTNGTVFIDPYAHFNTEFYISYYKHDFYKNQNFECHFNENQKPENQIKVNCKGHPIEGLKKIKTVKSSPSFGGARGGNSSSNSGDILRRYRLAMSVTGEYTTWHGGTVAAGLAAIVTTINRVNSVYEVDLDARLVLVANNNLIIFTNAATDPFTNNLINQNQGVVDNAIGNANYDIGHVMSQGGGGGVASYQSLCNNNSKARGETSLGTPQGDPFDIDYVAHEIGHQFGGSHTFNGNSGSCAGGNRSGNTAFEPGSGTTIMAYAGICNPQNIQNNSDDHFHAGSYDEIYTDYLIVGRANNCADTIHTGNNAPVANAGPDYTIPKSTPFELVGSATDIDGDTLVYRWEEMDLGQAGAPNSPTGDAPLFRSFPASRSSNRIFPRIVDIVLNRQTMGELLPSYGRNLDFRLMALDQRVGGGGIGFDEMEITVANNSGPFLVTNPNTNVTWNVGSIENVTWNVANTNVGPVNCSHVNILLSIDGGFTYPITLVSNTPNDGSEPILVPNNISNIARIKIEGANNIFFDISNSNFSINPPLAPNFALFTANLNQSICTPDSAFYNISVSQLAGFMDTVNLAVQNLPAGVNHYFTMNNLPPPFNPQLVITNTIGANLGNYMIDIVGSSPTVMQQTLNAQLNIGSANMAAANLQMPIDKSIAQPIQPTFDWDDVAGAATYEIEIATDSLFTNIAESANNLTNSNYSLTNKLAFSTNYFWRVKSVNQCGNTSFGTFFQFETELRNCVTRISLDVPKNISASGRPTISSTLNISSKAIITDINVKNLDGKHSWISDIDIILRSPSGTNATLFSQICNDEENFDVNFDDDALTGTLPCPPVGGGTYKSATPLSIFNGEPANGTWTLTIMDNANGDGGSLDNWELEICACVDPIMISTQPQNINTNSGNSAIFSVSANANTNLTYQWRKDGINIPGATMANYSIASTQLSDTGFYDCIIQNNCELDTTDLAELKIWGVGIENLDENAINFKLFPNPSNNKKVNISFEITKKEDYQIQIVNALGQSVLEKDLNQIQGKINQSLDLNQFSKGVYLLQLISGEKMLTKRFVLE